MSFQLNLNDTLGKESKERKTTGLVNGNIQISSYCICETLSGVLKQKLKSVKCYIPILLPRSLRLFFTLFFYFNFLQLDFFISEYGDWLRLQAPESDCWNQIFPSTLINCVRLDNFVLILLYFLFCIVGTKTAPTS